MSEPSFKIAVAQFPVPLHASWEAFAALVGDWVAHAAEAGARLLVLPEYGSMSLTALLPEAVRNDLQGQLVALQPFREAYRALHQQLAQQHGVYLLAGSFPWQLDDGRVVNRAFFCAPSGALSWQDKLVMTRFEREQWGVAAGGPLRVFETELGTIGVNICYDSEFPLIARAQAEAGASLILVPSCTDTLHGYWRVRVGAQARALENQCVVVQSPLVGEAPWSPAIDVNRGAAGVFGPPDVGFPADGVLALGSMDAEQWLFADLRLDRVDKVRRRGQVFNYRHWPDQPGAAAPLPPVETVSLR